MQKKYFFSFIFSAIIVLISATFYTSCKKSSDTGTPTTCTLSATSLSGTWSFKAITYKYTASSPSVDWLNDPSKTLTCQKDNTITFNANGAFNFNDAGVVCSPNASYSGTWTLAKDTLDLSTLSFPWPVTSFDCSTMVVTLNNYDTTGDQAIFTFQKN
jgi:hypothetical protein